MNQFYEQLPGVLAEGRPFAMGIITGIKGSSPQKQGAKALFFADGRIVGTMGGGCLEAEIQDRARRALLSRVPGGPGGQGRGRETRRLADPGRPAAGSGGYRNSSGATSFRWWRQMVHSWRPSPNA
jgi:xanthine/CO dehydrogenase XdhC/CoxF family maturation factor